MGVVHDEKNIDRGAICGGHQNSQYRAADGNDCSGSFGGGQAAEVLCQRAGIDAGCDLPSSQEGLGGVSGESRGSSRARTGDGDSAGSSGVHREEMGTPSTIGEKTGNLIMNNLAASIAGATAGSAGFKMKTLAATIQKGGQGKTMSICHLAHDAADRGLRVLVIDLDPQGNASHTLAQYACDVAGSQLFEASQFLGDYFANRDTSGITLIRKDNELSNIEKLELDDAAGQLKAHIDSISALFDVCFIDTPPFLSNLMSSAILCSDYVMSPVEMEVYSLQGMEMMVAVIQNLRAVNPNLEFIGMLPNRYNGRLKRHVKNLNEIREAYGELVMPFEICQRDSIAEALGEGQMPVWGLKHKSAARVAAKEVRAMTAYVLKAMEVVE